MVVKRKSVGLYKGRLCARGDSIPLNHTSPKSSPTSHRCSVKLVFAIAAIFGFNIHAVDVSPSFSDRPFESSRPLRNHSPSGESIAMDMSFIPPRIQSAIASAAIAWILAFETALWRTGRVPTLVHEIGNCTRNAVLRQLKSDICTYSHVESGQFRCILIVHAGGILYAGDAKFTNLVEKAIKQVRVGEVEILPIQVKLFLRGWKLNAAIMGSLYCLENRISKYWPKWT